MPAQAVEYLPQTGLHIHPKEAMGIQYQIPQRQTWTDRKVHLRDINAGE